MHLFIHTSCIKILSSQVTRSQKYSFQEEKIPIVCFQLFSISLSMAKKSSTSALSKDQHAAQDARYNEGHTYDYVIIGTGNAALTAAALLVNAGKTVCMLEAHDTPGGYAHTFHMGEYHFCAQVHYIWGCAPGGAIYEFLKKIGLEKDITFELMGPEGYDRMSLPDGKKVFIPYGWEQLAENIESAYPGQGKNVKKLTNILDKIRKEMGRFPERKLNLWDYLTKWPQFLTLIKYRNKTLQEVFDECGLSKEAQLVLAAQAGDLMEPPEDLSIFPYAGLFGGYNTGSYYPTKHFSYYIKRLAQFITDHEGCHIYYETEVNKINTEGEQITSIETKNGKVFTAPNFICNMDPQAAAHMIGIEKFPEEYKKSLNYEYSPAGVVVYIGLKDDIDLRDYGFGSFNTWHCEQWDMNKMWDEMGEVNFENPWVFLSTPTLHTKDPSHAPAGCQILELASYTEFKPFKDAQDSSYKDYYKMKDDVANKMIDLVEKRFIPNLRDHIRIKVVGTSATNLDFCLAPGGNAYGSRLIPKNMSGSRLKSKTPFTNLKWCNASSGWGGMYGTARTGVNLYMELTNDNFFTSGTGPTDDELVSLAQAQVKAKK